MSDEHATPQGCGRLRVVIVMGVTGSGKTTIGRLLANQIGWEFEDADDFHTAQAKARMAAGVGLTDEDRRPWLEALRQLIIQRMDADRPVVLACSALKRSYRDVLAVDRDREAVVYLRGDIDLIRQRLGRRIGHYAGVALLASQFQTLEQPRDALTVDIADAPEKIVAAIRSHLHL